MKTKSSKSQLFSAVDSSVSGSAPADAAEFSVPFPGSPESSSELELEDPDFV